MADVAALTWPLTRPGGMLYVPASRVRRCLFGPVDPEKTKLHLEEQMRKIKQQDQQRWNFDFENERPLESGRYLWQRVGGGGDPTDADTNGGSAEEEEDAGEKSPTPRREQTRITDFMRKRKSSSQKDSITLRSKTRRRSST